MQSNSVVPNRFLMLAVACLVLTGCYRVQPETFTVSGRWGGAAGQTLVLAQVPDTGGLRVAVDSSRLDSTGIFSLQGPHDHEGLYQLYLKSGPSILLINDAEDIRVTVLQDSLDDYRVSRSTASERIRVLYKGLVPLMAHRRRAEALFDEIRNQPKVSDSLLLARQMSMRAYEKAISDFLDRHIRQETNATAAWYALGTARSLMPEDRWLALAEEQRKRFPAHVGMAALLPRPAKPDSLPGVRDTTAPGLRDTMAVSE